MCNTFEKPREMEISILRNFFNLFKVCWSIKLRIKESVFQNSSCSFLSIKYI